MDEINLIEKTPKNFEFYLQKTLLIIGERLAIILFILCIPVFFLLFKTPQAFSEKEKEVFVKQQDNWYKKTAAVAPYENAVNTYSFTLATITPSPSPTPTPVVTSSENADVWDGLAECETHKNWSSDTGNGYYGGLQFNLSAWAGVGGSGKPSDATREEQIMRGKMLQEKRGWGPWGGCSKKLNLL